MKIAILWRAEKQYEKLPKLVQMAISGKLRELVAEQENVQVKKMEGYEDMYRVRVGKYRIVYNRQGDWIEILAVEHRKDVYRRRLG